MEVKKIDNNLQPLSSMQDQRILQMPTDLQSPSIFMETGDGKPKNISVMIEHDKPSTTKCFLETQKGARDRYELIRCIDEETAESYFDYYGIKPALNTNPNPSLSDIYSYILSSIKALVTTKPNRLHLDNVSTLVKLFGIRTGWAQKIKDEKTQYAIACELIKFIKILCKELEKAFPSDPCNDPAFEIDGMFLADYMLCNILKKTGEAGKQDVEKLADKCRKSFKEYKEGKTSLLSPWFNLDNETQEKPFHVSNMLVALSKSVAKDFVQNPFQKDAIIPKVRHTDAYVANRLRNKPLTNTEINKLVQDIQDIDIKNISVSTTGIHLKPCEDKGMCALYNLLHENSEHSNEKSNLFYAGNVHTALSCNTEHNKPQQVRLITNQHKYIKAYTGKSDYSGKEITTGVNSLKSLDKKKHLIIYSWTSEEKDNKKTSQILVNESLIKWYRYRPGKSKEELTEFKDIVQETDEEIWIIEFNDICISQINTRYVLYPHDISKRTEKASGGAKSVTPAIIAMRDFCLQQISYKNPSTIRDENELDIMLGLDSFKKAGRKQRVIESRNNAFKACQELGVMLSHKKQLGSSKQIQYVINFNLDFNASK